MKRFSITTKIFAIISLSAAFSVLAIFVLLHQISHVRAAYETVLDTQIREQNLASHFELSFKTEVQEWKNILLRGHDPRDLEKYRDDFFKQEALVIRPARDLLHGL